MAKGRTQVDYLGSSLLLCLCTPELHLTMYTKTFETLSPDNTSVQSTASLEC